ncbi:LysR family transcriptional regulator [Caulobacter sp. LARHSG274]
MVMDALRLDQLLVFVTAVDAGSFSGASRALNRGQTAVTYTIQKFEDQIGTPLFDRTQYRPTLTASGKALLPRARRILADANQLMDHAKALVLGLESEVRLGVSDTERMADLAPTCVDFRAMFPTVSLRIVRGSFGLGEALVEGRLDLAVVVDVDLPRSLERNPISTVDLIAVAAPSHPLAARRGPIGVDLLREELQIVLTDPREVAGSSEHGVAALDCWRVADFATKHALLCEGLGWGSMPSSLVAEDIAAGRLVALSVERWDGCDRMPSFQVVVARSRERALGPAGAALFAALVRDRGEAR